MKSIKILLFALPLGLLLLSAGSAQAQVKATPGDIKPAPPTKGKNSGRSNSDKCCPYDRWAYIPPQGDGRQISPQGEAGMLFGDPAPTVEVTVYNDKNKLQNPKSWSLKTVGNFLVVDLSRLPRGAYRVVFVAGERRKEGWVR